MTATLSEATEEALEALWALPAAEWVPLEYTQPLEDDAWTRGDEVIDFAERFMTFTRGFKRGEALEFSDWQKWLIRCMLEEDSPSGLFRFRRFICLLPRKNGKSLIGAAIVLHALVYSEQGDQIYSVARDRPQAKIVFTEVREQVERSPFLSQVIEVRRDYLKNKVTGVEYKALSSDGMGAQGFAPTLVVADELHGWAEKGRELYSAMTEGSADRPESLFIGISTAGATTESLLGELSEYGTKQAVKQRSEQDFDRTFGFAYWGSSEEEDPMSEETWKRANPNLATGMMSIEDFRSSISQAEATSLNAFLRYRLNRWVRSDGHEAYITPRQWDAAQKMEHLETGAEITVGFDGSISDDATGLVACDIATGILYTLGVWKKPDNDPDWSVPRDEVLMAIESTFDAYKVKKFYADPAFFRTELDEISKRYPRVISVIPQSRSRMVPMTADFKMDITSGRLFHNGEENMREHVLNSVLRPSGMLSKERPKSPKKIDLAVCALLAAAARAEVIKKAERVKRAQEASIF